MARASAGRTGGASGIAFEAPLWRYQGEAPWYFVTLPVEVADALTDGHDPGPGFGSVKVEVAAGEVTWSTSIFPDAKSASYVLPVKKEVRRRLGVDDGDHVAVRIRRADGT